MYLGIDIGTTNIKAVVLEADGRVVASGSSPVDITHLNNSGVEQDIEQIWSATIQAIAEATKSDIGMKVQAIGVSSQGGALQLLNDNGEALGKMISWQDGRGEDYSRRLTSQMGSDWFVEHIGHAGKMLGVGQILRLQHEQKDLFAQAKKIAFAGDIIVSYLCGRNAHDATSLSISSFFNPYLGKADPELLALLQLNEKMLPDLLSARESAGRLKDVVASRALLPADIPVSPVIHDQYAASVGVGATRSGDVMFGAGTAWVLLAMVDKLAKPVIDEAYLCIHTVEGLYGQLLSMVNGGSCFSWALNLLGLVGGDRQKIDSLLASVSPGCDGLRCWPLFTPPGGSSLHLTGAGRFDGIRLLHGPPHILRSVLEGLVLELGRYICFLEEADIPTERLVMCGGAAESSITPQIVANVTGLEVVCQSQSGASALGAAIIARGLTEPQTDLASLAEEMSPLSRRVRPNSDCQVYHTMLERYIRAL